MQFMLVVKAAFWRGWHWEVWDRSEARPLHGSMQRFATVEEAIQAGQQAALERWDRIVQWKPPED